MSTDISRRTALVGGLAGAGLVTLAACGSGGGSDTSSAPPDSSTSELAPLDSITVGEAVAAKLDDKPVIVARPTSTSAACFSAICTHQGCTVAPAGKELHCPCHGSVFDAATGAVISGPAPRALDKIQVKVEAGAVVPTSGGAA